MQAARFLGHLPIRCSTDKVNWQLCGTAFNQIPAWVQAAVPGIGGLWAPDISYFNGLYHLYYAGSLFATNMSVIYSWPRVPGCSSIPLKARRLSIRGIITICSFLLTTAAIRIRSKIPTELWSGEANSLTWTNGWPQIQP